MLCYILYYLTACFHYIVEILVKDFHQDLLDPSDLFYCSLESPGSCISNKRRRTIGRTRMMSQGRERTSAMRRSRRMTVLRRMGREKQMISRRGRRRRRRRGGGGGGGTGTKMDSCIAVVLQCPSGFHCNNKHPLNHDDDDIKQTLLHRTKHDLQNHGGMFR